MDESETRSMLGQVTIALEYSVDSFTQHVAKDIFKRQSLAKQLEHLAKADYEPSHHKCSYYAISITKETRLEGRVGVNREERRMDKGSTSHP